MTLYRTEKGRVFDDTTGATHTVPEGEFGIAAWVASLPLWVFDVPGKLLEGGTPKSERALLDAVEALERAESQIDTLPGLPYEYRLVQRVVCAVLRPFMQEGDMLIYRSQFRWHNAADNCVLPNHFESASLQSLAEEFNYYIRHDYGHVAIVRPT